MQNLLKDVITRFPDGSYAPEIREILKEKKPADDNQLMQYLIAIVKGMNEKGMYRDTESRMAALDFIRRLLKLQSQ